MNRKVVAGAFIDLSCPGRDCGHLYLAVGARQSHSLYPWAMRYSWPELPSAGWLLPALK